MGKIWQNLWVSCLRVPGGQIPIGITSHRRREVAGQFSALSHLHTPTSRVWYNPHAHPCTNCIFGSAIGIPKLPHGPRPKKKTPRNTQYARWRAHFVTFLRTAQGGTDFEHFAPFLSTFDTPNTHFARTHSGRDKTADTERHQIDKREEMGASLAWTKTNKNAVGRRVDV